MDSGVRLTLDNFAQPFIFKSSQAIPTGDAVLIIIGIVKNIETMEA